MSKRKKKHSKDRYFFGSVKVGTRGQIVIPQEAREVFNIKSGDQILIFGDISKGLGLIKASKLNQIATRFFKSFELEEENNQNKNGGNIDE